MSCSRRRIPRTGVRKADRPRDWTVDATAFLLAVLFGLAFLDSSLGVSTRDVSAAEVTLDVVFGGIGCLRWTIWQCRALGSIVQNASRRRRLEAR